MPGMLREHDLIQKAARGQGNVAFHMNKALNGIGISVFQHNAGHPGYISKVQDRLTELWNLNGGASMRNQTAIQLVEGLIQNIRTAIQNSPATKFGNLIF